MITIKLNPITSTENGELVSLSVGCGTKDLIQDNKRDLVLGEFMIDTGATRTLISKKVADYQGFEIVDKKPECVKYGNNDTQYWHTVVIPTLCIGSTIMHDVKALAADLPEIGPVKLAGILGLDILTKGYTIDFKNKMMIFN
jgi:predicted aspartyl protease